MNDATFLIDMRSGFACMGYTQFLPGYCLLFARPEAPGLNDLDIKARARFLLDMSLLGDAIMDVCKPVRVNYGILANKEPVLHAHLYPRYDWEPEERRTRNPWTYPDECWTAAEHQFAEDRHGTMKRQLVAALQTSMDAAYASMPDSAVM